MPATVRELNDLVSGSLHGDGEQLIQDGRSLSQAGPGHITFVENEKQAKHLPDCQASAVVVPESFPLNGRTLLRVKNPLAAFINIVQHLRGKEQPPVEGVDPRAAVHPSVILGPNCSVQPLACIGEGSILGARCCIYPGVVIGKHCLIGDDVTLYPNVVLYDGTVLGNRVILHANSVLGADGFGYRQQGGKHIKVPQMGNVEVGDDVEVGACSTIDRGTFDATRIGEGTKIDNHVQVAHNCLIGPFNLIVAQVGIAGSCSTGSHVILAGQAGIADHVHIGDRVIIGARSAVHSDILPGAVYLGTPATPEKEQKRIMVSLTRLPEMRRDLHRIKRLLNLNSEEAA